MLPHEDSLKINLINISVTRNCWGFSSFVLFAVCHGRYTKYWKMYCSKVPYRILPGIYWAFELRSRSSSWNKRLVMVLASWKRLDLQFCLGCSTWMYAPNKHIAWCVSGKSIIEMFCKFCVNLHIVFSCLYRVFCSVVCMLVILMFALEGSTMSADTGSDDFRFSFCCYIRATACPLNWNLQVF